METVSACEMGLRHQDADETIVIRQQWNRMRTVTAMTEDVF